MYDVIIFTNSPGARAIGSYRIRSALEYAGYSTKIIDFFTSKQSTDTLKLLLKKFCTKRTKIIGFSTAWTRFSYNLLTLLDEDTNRWIRSNWPGIKIISGGCDLLFHHSKFLDYKISGYADQLILSLLDYIREKNFNLRLKSSCDDPYKIPIVYNTIAEQRIIDINSIQTIWKKEDFIKSHEALPIEISRGCIFKCAFCAFPLNGKKKFDYIRPIDSLVEEFQRNYELFGITNYMFMDDTYNDSQEKLNLIDKVLEQLDFNIKFVTYIKPEMLTTWPHHIEQLKKQGLEGSTMGIESRNSITRSTIQKLKNFDKLIKPITELSKFSSNQANIILGLPYESVQNTLDTSQWLSNNSEFCVSQRISSLSISHPDWILESDVYYKSLIDLNPKKYGYDIDIDDKTYWPYANWRNEYTSFDEASRIANQINDYYLDMNPLSCWSISEFKSL